MTALLFVPQELGLGISGAMRISNHVERFCANFAVGNKALESRSSFI
jgi:hypothetical protein